MSFSFEERDKIKEAVNDLMTEYETDIARAITRVSKLKVVFTALWDDAGKLDKVEISFPTGDKIKDEVSIMQESQQGLFDGESTLDIEVSVLEEA